MCRQLLFMKAQILKNIALSIFALIFLFTYFQTEVTLSTFGRDEVIIAGGSGIKPPVR